jgi:hypothetical protein
MLKPYILKPTESSRKFLPKCCLICGKVATVDALFHLHDFLVLRRYCEECLDGAEFEEYLENDDSGFASKQEIAPVRLAMCDVYV